MGRRRSADADAYLTKTIRRWCGLAPRVSRARQGAAGPAAPKPAPARRVAPLSGAGVE